MGCPAGRAAGWQDQSSEAFLTVLWETLATAGIRLRKLYSYKSMENTTLPQAV